MRQQPKFLQSLFNKKKWDNFLYYYKYYLILGAFFLVLLITFVVDTVQNSKPVFQITYINIPSSMQAQMTEYSTDALAQTADSNRELEAEPLYISDAITIAEQETIIYRIAARMVSGEIDIFAAEYEVYLQYAADECFIDLQPYLSEEFLESFADCLVYSQAEDQQQITGLLWTSASSGKEYVLAVPFSSNLQQSAAAIILSFIQNEGTL